jgi:hypothetical protein
VSFGRSLRLYAYVCNKQCNSTNVSVRWIFGDTTAETACSGIVDGGPAWPNCAVYRALRAAICHYICSVMDDILLQASFTQLSDDISVPVSVLVRVAH